MGRSVMTQWIEHLPGGDEVIELTALQLVGGNLILLSLGILIGAIIGYNTPDKNGEKQ